VNVTRTPKRRSSSSNGGARAGHRERLIEAMALAIEKNGYRGTTIADVVRIARTSRRSFYEHFADRDACFLAVFDATNAELTAQVEASLAPELPWEQQIDRSLSTYLDSIASRPGLSGSFAYELAALGEVGAARQRAATEHFAQLLVTLVESALRDRSEPATHPLAMDLAIMIVGGLRELTIAAIQQGRDVHELRPLAAKAVGAIFDATVLERQSASTPPRVRGAAIDRRSTRTRARPA
jgi:AcrR family transcriptional regulator